MFKNKLILATPFIVLTVLFIFSLTLIPTVNPTPQNIPIVFVNEDQGVAIPDQGTKYFGEVIASNVMSIEGISDEDPLIKWEMVESREVAEEKLDQKDYYAAFIIPEDFSKNQTTLQTEQPTPPKVELLVNSGMNPMASTMITQAFDQIVDSINENIRTDILDNVQRQGETLTPEQASALVTPIIKQVTHVNAPGQNTMNGNAPVSLFQPLWMSSMAGAAILFLVISKIPIVNRKENFLIKCGQIIIGLVIALVAGLGLSWFASSVVGIDVPSYVDTAVFLSITYFSFFLMISAVLSWIGIRGIVLFVLTLFFGAPLLAMAPEFMSPFYRDWIYSWLPMRFMIEGLKDLFFFGGGLSWSFPLQVLVGIATVSGLIMIASVFKPASTAVAEKKETPQTLGKS
ncbi:YhgE/Pip domain-containing protein [Halalkalibacter okhensis]|uniref:Phage infection protein n=1 Tax=Halalkalibacter okhensis TaxID=333138 RepID=A0A0B0IPV8_9BACI|nr:ABC transporter permease [Halalkalibacter okhensis]KHF41716.1 phage infection protein [Halalkalibacter okhensis]